MNAQGPGQGEQRGALELEVTDGPATGSRIRVEQELVMGRQTDGAGQVADVEMSRRHARIARDVGGDYGIEDLGSSNGTFVNGLRISGVTLLSLGDKIDLGSTSLAIRSLPAPADVAQAPAPPPPPARDTQGTRARAVVPAAGQATPATGQATPPTLAVRVEVDFDRGTASVALDEGGDVITMSFVDGSWRAT